MVLGVQPIINVDMIPRTPFQHRAMTLSFIHEENKETGNQIAEFHGKVVNSDNMREVINKRHFHM